MVRIRFLNFGYIYTPVRTRSFQLFLKGLYMTSNSTTTCLKANKPVRLYSQKILQFKCCDIAGQPLLWRRNQRIYFRSNTWRRLSTYPGSFIKRKEILILIFAGKCCCLGLGCGQCCSGVFHRGTCTITCMFLLINT